MTQSYRTLNLGYAQSPALTAVAQTLQMDCDPAGTALVQVLAASALTGCTLTFEGRISETAPWVVLSAYVTNGTAKGTVIAVTPTLTAVPTNGWLISLNGCIQVRARLSAITGGSITLGMRLSDTPHG
jgi:hypothetical protein